MSLFLSLSVCVCVRTEDNLIPPFYLFIRTHTYTPDTHNTHIIICLSWRNTLHTFYWYTMTLFNLDWQKCITWCGHSQGWFKKKTREREREKKREEKGRKKIFVLPSTTLLSIANCTTQQHNNASSQTKEYQLHLFFLFFSRLYCLFKVHPKESFATICLE